MFFGILKPDTYNVPFDRLFVSNVHKHRKLRESIKFFIKFYLNLLKFVE